MENEIRREDKLTLRPLVPYQELSQSEKNERNEFEAKLPEMLKRKEQLQILHLSQMPFKEVGVFLTEATRCYIEGHFLATIVLCRALIEGALKDKLKPKRKIDLCGLINLAETSRVLSSELAEKAHVVRDRGNVYMHVKANEMTKHILSIGDKEALESFETTRAVIEKFYSP